MKNLRADFPILSNLENGERLVYLDSAATAQKPLCVLDAEREYYLRDNANPHRGVYDLSQRATQIHDDARETVRSFINAGSADEIVFTQNASEALNLVAYSYGLEFIKSGDRIVVAVSEHHSNLVPWQRVANKTGAELIYLYPDQNGHYTDEELSSKIIPGTKLVAMAQVSNVLGMINPVSKVIKMAHDVGAVAVIDCAQSIPHMRIDVQALDADFIAFSGHKIYAPMGIGVLYGRYGLLDKMPPFLSGGDMISQVHESGATYAAPPRKFEAGTRNVGGEAALARALSYVESIGWKEIESIEDSLMKAALEGLSRFPEIEIYGSMNPEERKGVISFNIGDIHPHDVATILDAGGVAIRAGHHCAQPLMDYLRINSCCRASFGVYNTLEDVEIFLDNIAKVRSWMGLGS